MQTVVFVPSTGDPVKHRLLANAVERRWLEAGLNVEIQPLDEGMRPFCMGGIHEGTVLAPSPPMRSVDGLFMLCTRSAVGLSGAGWSEGVVKALIVCPQAAHSPIQVAGEDLACANQMDLVYVATHQAADWLAAGLDAKRLRRLPEDVLTALVAGQPPTSPGANWAQSMLDEIRGRLLEPTRKGIGVVWEGSQFVYHSLAHVNRQLCSRLWPDEAFELSIKPYEADQFDPQIELPSMAPLKALVDRPLPETKVHVRHQWPPQFDPPAEGAWVMIQPWEFGGIPRDWVAPMRDLVDEIWVPTEWVRQCYVASGIPSNKVQVIANGVDLDVYKPEGALLPIPTSKRFKFLFVGGTIYRKGIDLVLEAFTSSFTRQDDVALVIKGQPGATYAGSDLGERLQAIRDQDPDAPEIVYLTDALRESELACLYRSCDALVLPYRGEGFGLPIAEAMASGLPVVVTSGGAADDFVRPEFALMVSARKRWFKSSQIEPSVAGSWLLEPELPSLCSAMRTLHSDPAKAKQMGSLARKYALAHLGWEIPSGLMKQRLIELAKRAPLRFQAKRTAFILDCSAQGSDWKEALLSYVSEFKPDEPVSLGIVMARDQGEVERDSAISQIARLIEQANLTDFPEIRLLTEANEVVDLLRGASVQWLAPPTDPALGLGGPYGQRMAASRLRHRQAWHELFRAQSSRSVAATGLVA